MRHVFAWSRFVRPLVSQAALLLVCTGGAHAALQGRDVDGVSSNGYEAFYDTTLNITWLADANYAKTTGFDADGGMTWDKATAWVGALDFHGVIGWRLPHFEAVNGVSVVDYPSSYKGVADVGYNITSSRNELAYMYYVNLGLQGTLGTDGSTHFDAGVNPTGKQTIPDGSGAFIANLKSNMYWTNVMFQPNIEKAWGLWTMFPVAGAHGFDYRYNDHYAWAVHDGDAFKVSVPTPTVDEPASAWLLLAGLGVCTHLMRSRRGLKNLAAAGA